MLIESHITATKPDLAEAIRRAGFTPTPEVRHTDFHRVYSLENVLGCYCAARAMAEWNETTGRYTLLA